MQPEARIFLSRSPSLAILDELLYKWDTSLSKDMDKLKIFAANTNVKLPEDSQDEIEDMDLAAIREAISVDPNYLELIQAMLSGLQIKDLHKNHPGRQYKSWWSQAKLMDDQPDSPIIFCG